ncbi:hypothetical protein C7437_1011386 [Psychrobacillus insolitus]|uniref:Uncharacterized protein n=1 Tax=Psychrobacillus insolitus TaxID=1461 RepID=A0A2W7MLL8_9BACI|nr:hypothetical protein [Psychrobacillus insolitus]PZX08262.1 hypothetical protein C7437_1011386 [Psychrobacillus insolitus]
MDKDEQEHQKFLEEPLEWCKEQDRILVDIDVKLHEMKEIAEYTLEHQLTSLEIDQLNSQLNELKREVDSLEEQLHPVAQ